MKDQYNYIFDEELEMVLQRFNEMLKAKEAKYFDVHEFEDIIDYYTDHQNLKYAELAVMHAKKQHPNIQSIKLKEVRLFLEKGQNNEAMLILNDLEKLEKTNSEIYFLKGLVNLVIQNKETAKRLFNTSIELFQEEKDEILYQVSINLLHFGFNNDAIEYLTRAYENNPNNLLVIYELANTYELIENYGFSIQFYKKYLDLDPFAETIWNALGQSYVEINCFHKAIEAFDFAISINPMYTSPYNNKAQIYIQKGEYNKAINIYEELIPLDIDNALIYFFIGDCYKQSGNYPMALKYFRKARSIDASNPDIWYQMGLAYFEQRKYKESVKYFEKSLQYNNQNSEVWFHLAEAYKFINKYDKALSAYKNVTVLNKHHDDAWVAYALLLSNQKQHKQAIQILDNAYPYNARSGKFNFTLSMLYYINKQYGKAVKFFEKGLQYDFNAYNKLLAGNMKGFPEKRFLSLIRKYSNQ